MYGDSRTTNSGGSDTPRLLEPEQEARRLDLVAQDEDIVWTEAKRLWKKDNPDLNIKPFKERYILGEIKVLPWEKYITKNE
jgi:hypothetical protein